VKRLAVGLALVLTACAGGGQSASSPRRAATSTTATQPAAPLSARVVLPSKSMLAGSTMDATLIVENHTGDALEFAGCGSPFAVALGNDDTQPAVAWPACRQGFTLPTGKSTYALPVVARYLSCGPGGPPCDGLDPPPLPPGEYQAKLYQNPDVVPAPTPVTIRVTP
jgi:hypothetical protein